MVPREMQSATWNKSSEAEGTEESSMNIELMLCALAFIMMMTFSAILLASAVLTAWKAAPSQPGLRASAPTADP